MKLENLELSIGILAYFHFSFQGYIGFIQSLLTSHFRPLASKFPYLPSYNILSIQLKVTILHPKPTNFE